MKDVVIVTAAGDSFFEWALSLLSSLRDLRIFPRIPFAIVDVGLTRQQRQSLTQAGVMIVAPRLPDWWHEEIRDNPGAASLLTRPYYPDMFVNARIILHVDADIWMLTPHAVESAVAAARSRGCDIAAAVHDHASYHADDTTVEWREAMHAVYAIQQTNITSDTYINAGLFAARSGSPVWEAWREVFARVAGRGGDHTINDQAALNVAIQEKNLRLRKLDPTCNWLSHLALPRVEPGIGRLTEPVAPFRPISALHVSGKDKAIVHSLQMPDGRRLDMALDRKSFMQARERFGRRTSR